MFQTKTANDEEKKARYTSCYELQLKNTTPVEMPNPDRISALQRDPFYFPI
jgi:hypothetical protein